MMALPLLAKVGFFMRFIGVVWILVALLLILIILVQKGKGGGLSAAFGGAGAGGLLGTKTGDFLTWVTISLVVLFFVLSVILVKYLRPLDPAGLGWESTSSGQNENTETEKVDGTVPPDAGTPDAGTPPITE